MKKYKAVVFDLFETLVTEWGHEKYTKRLMCKDLGVDIDSFSAIWEGQEQDRYIGSISFEESIREICQKCNKPVDKKTLSDITEHRMRTKSACFENINSNVFTMLDLIKSFGMKTAIVSNCSSEEVEVLKKSQLFQYFDEVVLSFEVHMQKPDSEIYEEASKRLGVGLKECIFVGDGGSNELEGARNVGMKAVQAKWYTNQFPKKRENIEGFVVAENPLDIIELLKDEQERKYKT